MVAAAWAEEELFALEAHGLRRQLEPLSSPQGATVQLGGQTLVNFSSNDYLGLASHPQLAAAAMQALRRHGVGSGASRLLVGDTTAHHALEERLADFTGAKAALLFNSGYAANVGVLSTLCGPDDVVFSDALNHASLIDGCRLSRAQVVVYPHADVGVLDALLSRHPARRRLVCTEAVFSMDGDLAPLRELVEVCRRHQAALLVDEAHALGVFGQTGAGLCEALGVAARVDVRMGTLGKALGAYGAFVACAKPLRELFFNRARSLVFSTSLPPVVCAAAQAAVDLVEEGELRRRLWRNVERFAAGIGASPPSPIFSVVLGSPERALWASRTLRAQGLLAKPIRPPTVPEGTSRLRLAVSAAHSEEQLDWAARAVKEVLDG
ncbi:MAG: 8-amino-7-oxononanoate synthase [Myxococcota bacterium]